MRSPSRSPLLSRALCITLIAATALLSGACKKLFGDSHPCDGCNEDGADRCDYAKDPPRCVPRTKAGQPCSDSDECLRTHGCVAGKCVIRPTAGQPCKEGGAKCVDGYCAKQGNVCKLYKKAKEPCSADVECGGTPCYKGSCLESGSGFKVPHPF